MKFIKEEDVETCVNSLFVLTNSEFEKLEKLMANLQISRKELVKMLSIILKLNIEEYKETMRYF